MSVGDHDKRQEDGAGGGVLTPLKTQLCRNAPAPTINDMVEVQAAIDRGTVDAHRGPVREGVEELAQRIVQTLRPADPESWDVNLQWLRLLLTPYATPAHPDLRGLLKECSELFEEMGFEQHGRIRKAIQAALAADDKLRATHDK